MFLKYMVDFEVIYGSRNQDYFKLCCENSLNRVQCDIG